MTTTLNRRVATQEATQARERLLQLGYTPLPSKGKLCLLKNWPHVRPDAAMIAEWARDLNLCSTGIRLEGQQIAIDLDVLNEAIVDELLDALWEMWPELDRAPQRIGRAPKVLYLASLPEGEPPLTLMASTRWQAPDGDLEHVEIFGGGRSRFIGWHGPHTLEDQIGPDGWVVHRTYSDGDTLVPAADLPVIPTAVLRSWLQRVDAIFEKAGYTPRVQQAGATAPFVRDITEGMSFDCNDGVLREGIESMTEYAALDPHARCALSFIDPTGLNTTRCRVSVSDDGELRIFDFGNWVTHAPATATTSEPLPDSGSLGAMLAALGYGGSPPAASQSDAPPAGAPGVAERTFVTHGGDLQQWEDDEVQRAAERFEAAYNELMYGMAYDTTEEVCRRIDHSPEIGLAVSRRMDSYANSSLVVIGPKGGRKKVNPLTAWVTSRDRIEVAGVRFLPDADPIYEEDDRNWLNLWRADDIDPELISPDAVVMWHRFLEHLIPDEREREWFDRFVAHKMVNPRFRGAAVLMVAASVQGAGRSTLMATLYEVFGGYAASISSAHLFDSNQRNGWMERALWAFGNEVKFSTKYSDRVQAYERLKDLVDPAQSRVRLDEKYQRPREATIYTTFLLATNRPDALPISADDRRFMIITNGGKMSEDMRAELYGQWYESGRPIARMVHSLRAYYRARGAAVVEAGEVGDLVDAPKWAAGREFMLEAGETDLDQVIAAALAAIPPSRIALTRDAFEKLILGELRMASMEHKRGAIRPFVTGLAGEVAARWGWQNVSQRQVRAGSFGVVRCVARTSAVTDFLAMSPDERAKVLGGEETGAVSQAR